MAAAGPLNSDVLVHIVATGWNCEQYVVKCLDSIALASARLARRPVITLVNDGSTDATGAYMEMHPLTQQSTVLANETQMGAAYSRHMSIVNEQTTDTVVVFVDLDDWLLPNALITIEQSYRDDPQILATFGNWIDDSGRRNPQGFYSAAEIDSDRHRKIRPFNGTHLRTFRRHLYDQINPDDLKDSEGNWLMVCTDVAVAFPVLDQCRGSQVLWIDTPIYVYRRRQNQGTIKIYGSEFKKATMDYLSARDPKSHRDE